MSKLKFLERYQRLRAAKKDLPNLTTWQVLAFHRKPIFACPICPRSGHTRIGIT